MFLLPKINKSQVPTIIKDPFKENMINEVHMHWYANDGLWRATIEFKNGNTKGEQRLVNSSDFDDITAQIRAIIESLK